MTVARAGTETETGALLRDPVLALLVTVGLAAAVALPFLTHAPNRLVSGEPIALAALFGPGRLILCAPLAVLIAASPFLPQSRGILTLVAAAAALLAAALAGIAGDAATALADPAAPARRTGFGSGFWVLVVVCGLIVTECVERLPLSVPARILAGILAVVPVVALLVAGRLDDLSILKEYANRRDVLGDAILRHLVIVGSALLPTLLIGLPLGVLAARRADWRGPLFAGLNLVQTIPSIALFALLMGPLSALAEAVPAAAGLGIRGIGLAPAVIALTLYALLPIVRNTAAGLAAVSPAALDAADGMGFSPRQRLWRVEIPLALPVFLAGLRITLVQSIGLAAVAALIGAGGLGAIMFQGLGAGALDLVLLAVVPLVALSIAADAAFRLAGALLTRGPR